MAPSRRKAAPTGGGKKRSRSKLTVDLSGSGSRRQQHGGRYEDALDDDVTPTLRDENVDSDNEDDDDDNNNYNRNEASGDDDDSEEKETVDAKKLRLAKEYLSKMEEQQSESEDDDDDESDEDDDDNDDNDGTTTRQKKPVVDKVGKRIAKERLRKSGLLQSHIADSVLEGVQSIRADIARKIGIDAASQAWIGGEAGGDYSERYAKAWLDANVVTYHRGHDLTPTCVSLSQDGHTAFSGAKDGSLIMWNVQEEGKKIAYIHPVVKHGNESNKTTKNANNNRNRREIMAIATSDDDRYLAVGGRDNCVRIFDIRTLGKTTSSNTPTPITTFEGHKKAVMALTFRSRTLDLYSGSEDRCIRRYDLNTMTYVETLYGHQSPIVGIHCAHKNRPVSIAKDRTVRVWKVEEDSHLVFRPGGDVGSAECVSVIQDGWFVTGHEDGRLALWKEEKKRPVANITAAHGFHGGASAVPRSVMCCNAVGLSDVLATGSNDGYLRLWRVSRSRWLRSFPLALNYG